MGPRPSGNRPGMRTRVVRRAARRPRLPHRAREGCSAGSARPVRCRRRGPGKARCGMATWATSIGAAALGCEDLMGAPGNERYYDANRRRWDESVPIHISSRGYDLDGFLRGEKSLYAVEMDEVGDVRGKSLLHLQCHFGMDTLNWARLGATVTGLDFSAEAINEARKLAVRIGVADATFVQSDVYAAHEAITERFDIVYTGIGALCWLHDIREWARIAAGFLKPGGFLYVYEGHPMLWALDTERDDGQLVLTEPYFELQRPSEYTSEFTYVDGPPLENT